MANDKLQGESGAYEATSCDVYYYKDQMVQRIGTLQDEKGQAIKEQNACFYLWEKDGYKKVNVDTQKYTFKKIESSEDEYLTKETISFQSK